MKEKWIEDLREGLSDFEMEAPEGLWESLGVETVAPMRSWRRKTAVAATLLALLSIGGSFLLWLGRGESLEVSNTKVAAYSSVSENAGDEPVHSFPTTAGEAQSTTTVFQKTTDILNAGDEEEELLSSTSGNESIASYTDTVSPEGQNTAVETDIRDYKQKDTGKEKPLYAVINPKRRCHENHNGRYAVAAYTSGIGQATESTGQRSGTNIGNGQLWSDSNSNYEWPDDTPLISETQHHQPIKAGITFQYGLTDRVSLETGIMYTSLSSDFTVSQGNKVSSGERQMHYIGIPLNVKLSVWSWKAVDLYLSAGVMGEKCVSNRFQTKSAAEEGLSLDQYSSQKEKPMQWSVNAAPGLQLRPLPNIGIFAEPGVSYYFNDGTNLSTIYKDRPWNFNLNVGVRLMLNPRK